MSLQGSKKSQHLSYVNLYIGPVSRDSEPRTSRSVGCRIGKRSGSKAHVTLNAVASYSQICTSLSRYSASPGNKMQVHGATEEAKIVST